jgi:sugar phosphate isomerase/epimerase
VSQQRAVPDGELQTSREALMDRRSFVQTVGATAAGVLASRRLDWNRGAHMDRVGLELYSVRHAMQKDPERTLAAVRDAGYTDVELLWSFNNFGRTPQQVRATLDQLGLRAPSAHISPATLTNGWDHALDTAKLLGQQYLIVPDFSESAKTLDDWRQWADRFNTAGAAARKAGLWLAFHNEPNHVKPIDGKVPYDIFVERTDPSAVRLQLDIGNMVMGGGDPMQYLQRYGDRYWTFHVKDVVADKSSDTELGKGIVPLKAILGSVKNLAEKPCFVEQEQPADELASARQNAAYMHSL